jgi:hypothetical protein
MSDEILNNEMLADAMEAFIKNEKNIYIFIEKAKEHKNFFNTSWEVAFIEADKILNPPVNTVKTR